MVAWLRLVLWAGFDGLFYFSMRRPRLLRVMFGLLRRWIPIYINPFATFGATVVVSRADDVQEVLQRTNDFLLGPVNERKILCGDFVISMDPERKYQREKGLIRDSLPPNRLQQLEDIVDGAAQRYFPRSTRQPSSFEVAEFAENITVAIVEEFWGLSAAGAQSTVVDALPGTDTLRLWLRKQAIVLGSRDPAPFGVREVGVRCCEEFESFVLAACRTHPPDAVDFIAHMLRHSGGDLEVTSRNIAALVMTGSAVVTKAFCHAFQELLLRDEPGGPRDQAIALARTPEHGPDRPARQRLGRFLIEALRFNPVFPVLPRYCVRATTLAAGTPRQTEVPPGSNVIAGALGAMFDPDAVQEPERFNPDRNLQLNPPFATPDWRYGSAPDGTPGTYVLFGGGGHWCIGDQMAIVEMASMARALLIRLDNPRVARRVRYDGSAAASLLVSFGR